MRTSLFEDLTVNSRSIRTSFVQCKVIDSSRKLRSLSAR